MGVHQRQLPVAPQVQFPDHQIDAKSVIAWVREHGHAYGADSSKVFVSGSSAGANLAGLCALTPNDPMFQPGFESVDTTVAGAILLYGYYGRQFGKRPRGRLRSSSPRDTSARGAAALHRPRDEGRVGHRRGARHFVVRLRAVGNTVVYAELPGGQHSFDVFHSPRFEAVVDGAEAFGAWVLRDS